MIPPALPLFGAQPLSGELRPPKPQPLSGAHPMSAVQPPSGVQLLSGAHRLPTSANQPHQRSFEQEKTLSLLEASFLGTWITRRDPARNLPVDDLAWHKERRVRTLHRQCLAHRFIRPRNVKARTGRRAAHRPRRQRGALHALRLHPLPKRLNAVVRKVVKRESVAFRHDAIVSSEQIFVGG